MKCNFSQSKYYAAKRPLMIIGTAAAVLFVLSIVFNGLTESGVFINVLLLATAIALPILVKRGCRYSNDEYVVVEDDRVLVRSLQLQKVDIMPLVTVTEIRKVDRLEIKKDKIIVYGVNKVKKTNLNNGAPLDKESVINVTTINRLYENEEIIINKLTEMEGK